MPHLSETERTTIIAIPPYQLTVRGIRTKLPDLETDRLLDAIIDRELPPAHNEAIEVCYSFGTVDRRRHERSFQALAAAVQALQHAIDALPDRIAAVLADHAATRR